jgi:hypothetical protein
MRNDGESAYQLRQLGGTDRDARSRKCFSLPPGPTVRASAVLVTCEWRNVRQRIGSELAENSQQAGKSCCLDNSSPPDYIHPLG